MKISIAKTKIMSFQGKEPVRTKIIIKDQVSHFNYLGTYIGYDKYYEVDIKLGKFQKIRGAINRVSGTRYVEK